MDPTTGGPFDFIKSLIMGNQQQNGQHQNTFGSLGTNNMWSPGSNGSLPPALSYGQDFARLLNSPAALPGGMAGNGGMPMSGMGPGMTPAPGQAGAPMNIAPGAAGAPLNTNAPGLWSPGGGNAANNQLAQAMASRLLSSPQIQPTNWMPMGR